jgi:hypothetical protein
MVMRWFSTKGGSAFGGRNQPSLKHNTGVGRKWSKERFGYLKQSWAEAWLSG